MYTLQNQSSSRSLVERFTLPIITTQHGSDLGSLTEEQAARLAKACPDRAAQLMFCIMYDLRPDPERFNSNNSNINPGRFDLRVRTVATENGLSYKTDARRSRTLSRFLQERGELEEKLERHRRSSVTVLVYSQS